MLADLPGGKNVFKKFFKEKESDIDLKIKIKLSSI